jgi:hypothetical protein
MGCGASTVGPPVLLAEIDSRYAHVLVTNQNAVVIAKRYLEKVALVRYDNTWSSSREGKPKMVEEDVIMVDNSRIGVYKGDTVNINTAEKMKDVEQYNTISNGVELHIVLQPLGDLPERVVVSVPEPSTREFSVRHDDPLAVFENKGFDRGVTPETSAGDSTVSSLPGTSPPSLASTPREVTGWRVWEPETPFNSDLPSPKQLENARVYRRLSVQLQALEVESVTSSSAAGSATCSPYCSEGVQQTPKACETPSAIARRRRSVCSAPESTPSAKSAGLEEQNAAPLRQRRHSACGVQRLDEKLEQDQREPRLQKQLTSVSENQIQQAEMPVTPPPSFLQQQQPHVPTLDAQPAHSSIHSRRRRPASSPSSTTSGLCIDAPQSPTSPSPKVRFATGEAQVPEPAKASQRQRRQSIA